MSDASSRNREPSTYAPPVQPANASAGLTRNLPSIQSTQPNDSSAAIHDVQHRTSSVHGVSMRPTPPPSSTPPEQRLSRPIGVDNLLNPAAGGSSASGSRRHDVDRHNSPLAASLAPMSRPTTPSAASTSAATTSVGDITLPSITPHSMPNYPQPIPRSMTPRSPTSYGPGPFSTGFPAATIDAKQSPFIMPHESSSTGPSPLYSTSATTASNPAQNAYAPPNYPIHSSPRLRQVSHNGHVPTTYPRMQTLLDGTANMAPSQFSSSRSSSPSLHQHRTPPPTTNPIGQPQSFFSAPFSSSGPASTMAQLAYDKKSSVITAPAGHSQYQMMTLETESGPIQVPVDVQAASKVADEKRKRNATASHRFRQRRKEKEQETSNNISKLEAQIRQMTEEKEFYQRERDFLQDVVQTNRIPVPPRPASPRRRRHASLGGANQDPESSRDEGRNTRRRTSAYVPPQGPPPHAGEPLPAMPSFERLTSMPSEPVQGLQQRMRQHGPFHPNANPFDPSAPR